LRQQRTSVLIMTVYELIRLEEVTRSEVIPNKETIQQVNLQRQEVVQTISKRQRDNSFRARVLRAYNYRCAFSGIQLRLVDFNFHDEPIPLQ
jgi:predicted restriction endonuclease